jgi:hypothetical protein
MRTFKTALLVAAISYCCLVATAVGRSILYPPKLPAMVLPAPVINTKPVYLLTQQQVNDYMSHRLAIGCLHVNADGVEYIDPARPECQ